MSWPLWVKIDEHESVPLKDYEFDDRATVNDPGAYSEIRPTLDRSRFLRLQIRATDAGRLPSLHPFDGARRVTIEADFKLLDCTALLVEIRTQVGWGASFTELIFDVEDS